MSDYGTFRPKKNGAKTSVVLATGGSLNFGKGESVVRIANTGNLSIFVRLFNSSAGAEVASVADTPLAIQTFTGCTIVLEKPIEFDSVAFITASGTSAISIQPGYGGS